MLRELQHPHCTLWNLELALAQHPQPWKLWVSKGGVGGLQALRKASRCAGAGARGGWQPDSDACGGGGRGDGREQAACSCGCACRGRGTPSRGMSLLELPESHRFCVPWPPSWWTSAAIAPVKKTLMMHGTRLQGKEMAGMACTEDWCAEPGHTPQDTSAIVTIGTKRDVCSLSRQHSEGIPVIAVSLFCSGVAAKAQSIRGRSTRRRHRPIRRR